ncbi:acyltransferase domain-containing protein [Streptomyces microflavus]|uniref:acyltransferase domain-containing protein n=1 Tax=Streptomyces microflavus TaxID=1919 RepID=UPI0037D6D9A6
MFPGPSSHIAGTLAPLLREKTRHVEALLRRVDAVSVRQGWGLVSPLLTEPATKQAAPEHPGHLWLGYFATSLVLFEKLRESGARFDVLVGHSGGEFTALTAAGWLDAGEAARLLSLRYEAVQHSELPASGMTALEAPLLRVEHLCGVVDAGSLAIAVDNGPGQVVVSGFTQALERLEQVALAAGIKAHRLGIPSAYHNPLLAGAARDLAAATGDIRISRGAGRVYSPQLGRDISAPDDVRDLIAATLITPVRFRTALRDLYDEGVRVFVECGAKQVLTDLATAGVAPDVRCVPLLPSRLAADQVAQQLSGLSELQGEGSLPPRTGSGVSARPVPGAAGDTEPLGRTEGEATAADETDPVPEGPAPSPGATEDKEPSPAPVSASRSDASLVPAPAPAGEVVGHSESDLLEMVRQALVRALDLPPEVIEDDSELAADLGVSSLNQTLVFVELLNQLGLPNPEGGFNMAAYRTVADLAGLLRKMERET